jgi:hypothetical protein
MTAVAVAVVPPVGAAVNAIVGVVVQPNPKGVAL